MTTFFCMRHGLTEWNRECRIQGNSDIELCDEGRDMARKWGESLAGEGFDCILTSTLSRAKETGALVNEVLGLPMYEDERLGEQDWGKWTGLTKTDLKGMRRRTPWPVRAGGHPQRGAALPGPRPVRVRVHARRSRGISSLPAAPHRMH